MSVKSLCALAATCVALAVVPAAHAAPALTGEFDLGGATPGEVTLGPDGFIWVVLSGSANDLARVSADGAVTFISSATINNAVGITAGPDNNLWLTQPNGVVKLTASATPTIQAFTINAISDPRGITSGPDNNLWAASGDKVVKFDPTNPLGFQEFNGVVTGARGITASSDGLLWVADFGGQRIVSVTTAGVGTNFNVGGGPQQVGAGPNGQILYANPGTAPQTIGRLTAGGAAQTTDTPNADPFGIRFATDGAYWIAQFASDNLGRVTPTGEYTTFPLPAGSGPRQLAVGPQNTLWVSLETSKKIARVSGVDPAPVTTTLSGLKLTPAAFKASRKSTAVSITAKRKRYKTGTSIGFNLTVGASVTFTVSRVAVGKRRGAKCVRPTKRNERAKRCTRIVRIGSFVRSGVTGANKVAFTGRIGKRRALTPGRYRLTASAVVPGGTVASTSSRSFRIVTGK